MQFIHEYSLFLAKSATVVVAILLIIAGIALIALLAKTKEKTGKLIIQKINDKYKGYQQVMNESAQSKIERKHNKKTRKKNDTPKEPISKKRLFVLNFTGDIKASAVHSLREEITAILLTQKKGDEVLLCLESAGGLVHSYGLAAAQIQRLKDQNIKITVAIDKIAASGGYLMACVGDYVIAAPFAVIGSIGVIAQLPNFHRWLEKNEIDFEQITAGQYKRTLTLFGKNTEEGRVKLQEEINEAHRLFKNFIQRFRPKVDIEQVATGEHWFASRAMELQLVDDIQTSDDFLLKAYEQNDIYLVKFELKKSFTQKLGATAQSIVGQLI